MVKEKNTPLYIETMEKGQNEIQGT